MTYEIKRGRKSGQDRPARDELLMLEPGRGIVQYRA
jgi:hypothetical protein